MRKTNEPSGNVHIFFEHLNDCFMYLPLNSYCLQLQSHYIPVGPCISSLMSLCFYIYYSSLCREQSFIHLAIVLLPSLPFFLPSTPARNST